METRKIEIDMSRYDELLAKEELLHTMQAALHKCFYNSDFDFFKRMFERKEVTNDE